MYVDIDPLLRSHDYMSEWKNLINKQVNTATSKEMVWSVFYAIFVKWVQIL